MNRFLENQDIDITTGKLYFDEQIPCAFFLTKRPILEKIGLMDDNFVLFFEDVDLSFRIAKYHKLAVDTSIKITHLGGSSFKTDDNWWLHGRYIASMIYFFRKHYSSFRTFLLKVTVYLNTYAVIGTEYIKKLFGNKDDYRMKKHKYQLKLLKENK
jgi:GT2 family glycosyltransferase